MSNKSAATAGALRLGVDYTLENGAWVFTEAYHLQRGYCCRNGCRYCPYDDHAAASLPSLRHGEPSAPRDPETCENCGSAFECRPGNCWCETVSVSPEALAKIRLRFDRCLCPDCLATFAKDVC